MGKRHIGALALVAVAVMLTGCSAGSPENAARDACVKQSMTGVDYDSIDTSGVTAADVEGALFESGIRDTHDTSKVEYLVLGPVIVTQGSAEKRFTVSCKVTVEGNQVIQTDADLPS